MATYKEIHGVKVQYRDSDATAIEGDVWYNSSTGLLKMYASGGSWASGGNMNTARGKAVGSAGTQTAGLAMGGNDGSKRGFTGTYDGSSWTEVADMAEKGRNATGFGTSTAALAVGGYDLAGAGAGTAVDTTEEWNGASWSEGGDLASGVRTYQGSAGTQTAGLMIAGYPPPSNAQVESYDGSSWTEIADTNTGRGGLCGIGIQTAALAIGGQTNAIVESWNGTAWTEVGDLSESKNEASTSGTSTAGLVYGGGAPDTATVNTESWDGSSWTEVANLATARVAGYGSPAGTSSLALMAGGGTGSQGESGFTGVTEEWEVGASIETVSFD